jgi:N-methylhydantoinase A
MQIAINVDTGVLFTDAVVTGQDGLTWVKVATNHASPTRSFINCLQKIADKIGLSPTEVLAQSMFIRWSSGITGDLLLQKCKSRLGLIISRSLQNEIPPYPDSIISPDMIIGIKGEVDSSGKITEEVKEEEIVNAIEQFVDSGTTGIVVALCGAFFNPAQEKKVREIMRREYPAHYLGSADLFLSSEVAAVADDRLRTNTAVLNAWLHQDIARHASGIEDAAHETGYNLPLLITHGTGAVATQVRTKSLDVYNSSTAAAALGCATLAEQLYGIRDFVYLDIGGGSQANIGVVHQGKPLTSDEAVIGNMLVRISMIDIKSACGGSSAVAWVEPGKRSIKVGPLTTALSLGPAGYDLGGTEPTVLDADLVLGYLNPDNFLVDNGIKLNAEKSIAAIRKVASETGQSVEAAARTIVEVAEANTAEAIKQEIEKRQLKPDSLTLFAFGGAGGSRGCGCAERLGINRVITFSFNAVAGAALASITGLNHTYETTAVLALQSDDKVYLKPDDYQSFNRLVRQLEMQVRTAIQAEGLNIDRVRFTLELKLSGTAGETIVEHPLCQLADETQVADICNAYLAALPNSGVRGNEINLERIVLRASYPVPGISFPAQDYQGADSSAAVKEKRPVYWGEALAETRIYQHDLLACGNVVAGPAIIEAPATTYLVPPGWKYSVDQYLNGIMEVSK